MSQFGENCIDYVITLTDADAEYSQALSVDSVVKKIEIQARASAAVRHSFGAGNVAASGSTSCMTIKAGASYMSDLLELNRTTLYLASSAAGTVVEVRIWI